jgi:hypothetical protein
VQVDKLPDLLKSHRSGVGMSLILRAARDVPLHLLSEEYEKVSHTRGHVRLLFPWCHRVGTRCCLLLPFRQSVMMCVVRNGFLAACGTWRRRGHVSHALSCKGCGSTPVKSIARDAAAAAAAAGCLVAHIRISVCS